MLTLLDGVGLALLLAHWLHSLTRLLDCLLWQLKLNRRRTILSRLQIISNASSAVLKRVFSLCGTPRWIIAMLTPKCWYELTRRGFLTPPDCLVIIWCQLLLHISVLLVLLQRNPQDFIVPINSFSVRPPTLLIALSQCPKTNYKGLIDKGINLSLLNRQLNRVYTLLFLREICLYTTLKPFGVLLSLTRPYNP